MVGSGDSGPDNGTSQEEKAALASHNPTLKRFRCSRVLQQCPGIETYLGSDPATDQTVIIKAVSRRVASGGTPMRLEHDAALLRQVSSPWIAPLLEVVGDEESLYLVSRHVPGISLRERLQRKPVGLGEALRLASCLFSALQEIHQVGVLHRDIKPSNIIIDSPSDLQRATLTDFGPAPSVQPDALERSKLLESAQFMSPERAGSIDHDVGEAADLYSAGVVLFACLSGAPPFAGDSTGTVLSNT